MRKLAAWIVCGSFAAFGLIVPGGPAGASTLVHDRLVSANPANYTPQILDGQVLAIVEVGDRIILGGDFTQVQNNPDGAVLTRNYILAFDKHTGVVDDGFVPQVNAPVRALAQAPGDDQVYIAGSFYRLNDQAIAAVALLNVVDGTRVATFKPKNVDGQVEDMKFANGRLFIAGHFTTVDSIPRKALAELDPTTSALLPNVDFDFQGIHWGGDTHVYKMEVTPDGRRMIVLGNFLTVNGQDRVEVAMLDLSTSPATVADWQTDRFKPRCYSRFTFVVRDVDVSPDGRYFVIVTTGGFGSGPPTLCDSVSRWEVDDRGAARNPTWVNWTGGDSTLAVTITGVTVYVGGHERWENNPFAADAAGPGAVSREGIAALDPRNGLPFSWNPGRTLGLGVRDFLATSDGLWMGSDTDRVADELHGRIAFFPLTPAGIVPQPDPPELPADVYAASPKASPTGSSNVLYRVNAGGPSLSALDDGPDWSADNGATSPYHNGGNTAANYSPLTSVAASVPSTTPIDVFSSERYDTSSTAPDMQWDFAVPAGRHVAVRLYFANQNGSTKKVGSRVFKVSIDGQAKLTNYDIVKDVGDKRGVMKSFDLTSDGNIDLDFGRVTNNPLVNAVELVDSDATPPLASTSVTRRNFDGTTVGNVTLLPASGIAWDQARGALLLNGNVYTPWSDGHLYRRPFNGATFGPASDVALHGLTAFATEMQSMTSLWYDNGRIFFTRANQTSLYMRYFTVEDDMVGAQVFTVSGNLSGIEWSKVQGAFLAEGKLYWAHRDTGELRSLDWASGGPVAGTANTLSGPAIDGVDWRAKALFAATSQVNREPTAAIRRSCTNLACNFSSSESGDTDGTITSYFWDFGDGTSATTPSADHTYQSAGTYPVTLVVTDDRGAVGQDGVSVVVSSNVQPIGFVGSSNDPQTGSVRTHRVIVPPGVQAGDAMLLTFADNAPTQTVTPPVGWSPIATASTAGMASVVWKRVASETDAGSTVSVSTSDYARAELVLVAYRGADVIDPVSASALLAETLAQQAHTTPTLDVAKPGSWVVSYWADKSLETTAWTAPAGQTVRYLGSSQTGSGHVTTLLTDGNANVPVGAGGGLTAVANAASKNATMGTFVLSPSG